MKTILTFLFVFCVIVIIHELGHFLFAKWSGILVREFSIGMGPKIFAHRGKDGTTYTLRLLPIGGYVRMAGVGEEEVEITPGQPISLELNEEQVVTRINTSNKVQLPNSVPVEVIEFDLEEALFIKGYVNGDENQETRYRVDHDASIIEADGTEVRIAPKDVQFQAAKLYKRFLTNFAGPLFNFILTFVLVVIIIFMQGGATVADTSSTIGGVAEGGIADKAGIKPGDRIIEIDDEKISTFDEIVAAVDKYEDQKVDVIVERDGKEHELSMTPKAQEQADGSSKVMIGINGGSKIEKLSFGGKLKAAVAQTIASATVLIMAVKDLIFSFSLNKLGGPVMILQLSSEVANQGLIRILEFMAMLSVNLGIMNLLPIPALDGGKLVLNVVEGIRRKPLSPESEGKITIVGFAFIMILMVLVTWNDIMRFFF